MKRNLITEEFTNVNTSIISESWYEEELVATFMAYGMDEIEIDLLLNDPDVEQEIKDAEERGFGPEKTALYLLQKADEAGLVPNEKTIEECGDDHPAGEWQQREADRRFQEEPEDYDPENYEEPLDEKINEVSLGDMYREMGTWMQLNPRMQKIADESGLNDANSEDLQYLVNGWMDGAYDEDPEILMSELENIIEQL